MPSLREIFNGKYSAVDAPELLPSGAIAGGKNMRKIGRLGGWKPRRGYTLLNTTAAGDEILSIHHYKHPKEGDYHLISQLAGTLRDSTANTEEVQDEAGGTVLDETGYPILAELTANPFTQATILGSTLYGTAHTAKPGFSALVGDDWIYADGSGPALIYGGDNPLCETLLVACGTWFVDYGQLVRDKDQSTYAVLPGGSVTYYVASKEIAEGILLNFGTTKNTNVVTVAVAGWQSGSWTSHAVSDETSGTTTHDTDGVISWTRDADDEMTIIGNLQAYWYRVTFSGTITETHITRCRVIRDITTITNKWDSTYRYLTGALFYDQPTGQYQDRLGVVSNEAEDEAMDISSATTSDYIYFKAPEQIGVLGFGVTPANANDADAQVDLLEGFNGNGWTSIAFQDTTLDVVGDSSFGQTGLLILSAYPTLHKMAFTAAGDYTPGYWYRISWDAALGASTKLHFIVYGAQPKALPTLSGVVEFKGRALYWGHPDWPNRLLVSPYDKPDQLCTIDERLSQPFGGNDPILACVALQKYVAVFKEGQVFLTEDGFTPYALTTTIGLASLKSLAVAEVGDATLNRDQVQTVILWVAHDGAYKTDGIGVIKTSDSVDNYFNPLYSDALSASELAAVQGKVNPNTNEYMLLLPDRTLVYNILLDEWYPPWYYELILSTLSPVKDESGKIRIVAGTVGGFLVLLEEATSDKNSSDVETAIEHELLTRVFLSDEGFVEILVRDLWAAFDKRSSGDITVELYKDFGQVVSSSESVALVSSESVTRLVKNITQSAQNVLAFQIKFSCTTLNVELWIYWMSALYEATHIATS